METELCAGAATYKDLLNDDDVQKKLDRLARHKSRIERTFHRSLKELKVLQTNAVIQSMIPLHIRAAALPPPPLSKLQNERAPGAAPIVEIPPEALGQELEAVELE
ncbi:MAG TPA: hypothetical protein VNX70_20180 [Bryobacteraceae bacterium]|nr:hypothetical protein [Bryobacteraceae bacterium]